MAPIEPNPAHLSIVIYPDPVLRQKAAQVQEVTENVRAVAARMIDLMFESRGIGLAAPQVGLPWRMFVCHVPLDPDDQNENTDPAAGPLTATSEPVVYINPVLDRPEGPTESMSEGCLSLPEIRGDVMRPREINITALNRNGDSFTQAATGLLARCWQHETDHLDGVLILDRMSQLSRLRTRSAVRGLEKAAGIR